MRRTSSAVLNATIFNCGHLPLHVILKDPFNEIIFFLALRIKVLYVYLFI